MKILYFDVETTGTDHTVHEITQFAALVEIDGVLKEEVNWRCQPTRWDKIDPGALQTTGVTVEQLKAEQNPQAMFRQIHGLFNKYINKFDRSDKFYPAGHNVSFDLDFLQAFWKQHGDQYGTGTYQNWRALDSRVFANFLSIKGMLDLPDLKLATLAKYMGVKIDAHDALSDIKATREILHMMLDTIK